MSEREETFSGRTELGNGDGNISVQGRGLGESWASGNFGKGGDGIKTRILACMWRHGGSVSTRECRMGTGQGRERWVSL